MSERTEPANIDRTAAHWVALEDRGPLTPEQSARLQAWLDADPRHFGAYARARAVFARVDRAAALRGGDLAATSSARASRPLSRRRFLQAAATAAAAGIAGVAWWGLRDRRYATRLGEVLRLPLQDGSVVTLNSASTLSVEFGERRRLVRLLRGEALFEVARDALRPFVVEAAGVQAVAIGTSFTVDRSADAQVQVQVMVRSGVVDCGSLDTPRRAPIRLTANTLAEARGGRDLHVRTLRPIEVSRRLAWRDGMISFDGDTLAQAASQFARYSDVRIVLDDPRAAGRRVVGLYSANDPAGFARAAAASLGLRVRRDGDAVHLASR